MSDPDILRQALQRIATGPTMSRDLSRGEACAAMRLLLDGSADPVQAGIFLIALRMKRETDEELAGVLDAIHAGLQPQAVDVDRLVTVVDPYDGYLRGTPVTAFLPCLLAAAGQHVLIHGVESMGPKFGATQSQVLAAAGLAPQQSLAGGAAEIADDAIGWTFLDQSVLAPELAALTELRTRIVKRPCLTTVEVAVNALQARISSTLVTGYVHKGYPPVYAALAEAGGFDRCLIVRGVEGGVQPSLSQESRYFAGSGSDDLTLTDLDPASLAIERSERSVPLPDALSTEDPGARSVQYPGNAFATTLAAHAADAGLTALEGRPGPARDALIYAGAIILFAEGQAASLADAGRQLGELLDAGAARQRFDALVTSRSGR